MRRLPIEEPKRMLAKLVHRSYSGLALNERYVGDGVHA
jgi:hypothetical protein